LQQIYFYYRLVLIAQRKISVLATPVTTQWFLTFLRTRTPWAFIKFSRAPCLKASSNCYQRARLGCKMDCSVLQRQPLLPHLWTAS